MLMVVKRWKEERVSSVTIVDLRIVAPKSILIEHTHFYKACKIFK